MIVAAVHATNWWGPFGWLYRNTPGNLAASGIAFVVGLSAGVLGRKRIDRWVGKHLSRHINGALAAHHSGIHDKLDAIVDHLGIDLQGDGLGT